MKRTVAIIMVVAMMLSLCACGGQKTEVVEEERMMKTFTDSAGREVQVPSDIKRIIPSGDMAMMFIWPLAWDKLAAVPKTLTEEQRYYLGDSTDGLVEVGNLYKTGDQLNVEEVARLNADIIIDFGEAKENISEDLDYLQELLGIPCVFISGTLENSADSYRMLGELLGMEEDAQEIALYIDKIISTTQEVFKTVEKKDAVILNGQGGLGCVAAGTYFDEIWAYMMNNVAVVDEKQMYASTGIDFEQLANWDPEYLFFYGSQSPDEIVDADTWQQLSAVKEGKFYEVPSGPYSFVSPPTINRYLAIIWLADIVYPGVFGWDTQEMIKEFYDLFYHYELSDTEYNEIVKG